MLVALVLTVCSLTNPELCKREELIFEGDGNLAHCMAEAPPYIAIWTEQHPKWKVSRWKCDRPGTAEGNI
jgi:hypothetical protein